MHSTTLGKDRTATKHGSPGDAVIVRATPAPRKPAPMLRPDLTAARGGGTEHGPQSDVAMQFAGIETWVFDLDETLYPPSTPLFPQIEARMAAWLVRRLGIDREAADRLRARWWHDHGTTLAGLMREHGDDPEPFLAEVHDIDFSVLTPDPTLAAAIADLPGRKVVYTNGTTSYARNVLKARALDGLWDAVHGVEHAGYIPKPEREAYVRVFASDGLDPRRAAMFEDTSRNLLVPHEMGMTTIHVAPRRAPGAHVHHHTSDLAAFLRDLATGSEAPRGLPASR